jgi:hypothetical protein
MSLLSEASEEKKFDVRLTERHVRRGHLTFEDIKKAVDKLPDDQKEVTWTSWAEVEKPGE